jgi:hypothetical protein
MFGWGSGLRKAVHEHLEGRFFSHHAVWFGCRCLGAAVGAGCREGQSSADPGNWGVATRTLFNQHNLACCVVHNLVPSTLILNAQQLRSRPEGERPMTIANSGAPLLREWCQI